MHAVKALLYTASLLGEFYFLIAKRIALSYNKNIFRSYRAAKGLQTECRPTLVLPTALYFHSRNTQVSYASAVFEGLVINRADLLTGS